MKCDPTFWQALTGFWSIVIAVALFLWGMVKVSKDFD